MPGTWMRFTRSGVQTQRWWDLAQQREQDHSFAAWSEEFLAILDDATRIRLRADVPWGAFLSGGVDSSSIVGLMARHVDRPVKTFCIGFADPRFDESGYAAEAARRFGCEHTMEIARAQHAGPLAAGAAPPGPAARRCLLHADAARQRTGGAAREGGAHRRWRRRAVRRLREVRGLLRQPRRRAARASGFPARYFDSISLFSPPASRPVPAGRRPRSLQGIDSFSAAARPWFDEAAHFDRVNQALYLDMQLLLSGNNLVKPDRMGMAVSIEARTPFLDWRMMEFAFRSRGAPSCRPTATRSIGTSRPWCR
jgi:asparagine synthase (glutamine-hydrolysing)